MFGLLRFRKSCRGSKEEWKLWRLHYCGTCKAMGRSYGQASRMLLNHDTVFLAEILTALSPQPAAEWPASIRSFHCFSLPRDEREVPAALLYAAAATVVLGEYKLRDRVEDATSHWSRQIWSLARRWWNPRFRKACRHLRQCGFDVDALNAALSGQMEVERPVSRGDAAGDPSQPTAAAVSMFYAHGSHLIGRPDLEPSLARFGASFGALIYWLDAWEDLRSDAKSGQFNAIAANGWSRSEAIAVMDRYAAEAIDALRDAGGGGGGGAIAASFASRLRSNLDPRLGRAFTTTSCCKASAAAGASPAAKISWIRRWAEAWDRAEALAEGRAWPVLAAVALAVFVFPEHSRAAESPEECMSLSANLMALGSLVAVAIGGRKRRKAAAAAATTAAAGATAAGTGATAAGGGGGGCCGANCCVADACASTECCCEGTECCCEIGECGSCCECASCCDC